MKPAKPAVMTRPADAALGRQTRGLVGPARRGSAIPARSVGRRLRLPRRIVTPARATALLGMLACGFALTFATGPTAFGLTRTDLPDLAWTDDALVHESLALQDGGNVFRLDTAPLVAALEALPAVARASVAVSIPDAAVVVSIEERTPVLAWEVGETRYIADGSGVIFAQVDDDAPLPAGVAVVDDRRIDAGASLAIGGRLDAIDHDVATRLGSLVPADVGSAAPRLRVIVTQADGFIVQAAGGWNAVFGFYSPATRPTDMIPGQVRLLRSLLEGREPTFARIILASATDGTYVPQPTPKATAR